MSWYLYVYIPSLKLKAEEERVTASRIFSAWIYEQRCVLLRVRCSSLASIYLPCLEEGCTVVATSSVVAVSSREMLVDRYDILLSEGEGTSNEMELACLTIEKGIQGCRRRAGQVELHHPSSMSL